MAVRVIPGLEGAIDSAQQQERLELLRAGEQVVGPQELAEAARRPIQSCSAASRVAAGIGAVCSGATGVTVWAASVTEDPRIRVIAAVAASAFGTAALVASCCALRLRQQQ